MDTKRTDWILYIGAFMFPLLLFYAGVSIGVMFDAFTDQQLFYLLGYELKNRIVSAPGLSLAVLMILLALDGLLLFEAKDRRIYLFIFLGCVAVAALCYPLAIT
ncbi:hypothetical protein [Persephonella sp.]